jgi:hypothetical protein
MTKFAHFILMLTSVAPIVFVYGASIAYEKPTRAGALTCVVLLLGAVCALMLRGAARVEKLVKAVKDVSGLEKESLAFLVAYALPVVTAAAKPPASTEWPSAACALAAFAVVMALVVWQQQLFYVNPLASILGYHFFSATLEGGEKILIVSKSKTITPGELRLGKLSEYLWVRAG